MEANVLEISPKMFWYLNLPRAVLMDAEGRKWAADRHLRTQVFLHGIWQKLPSIYSLLQLPRISKYVDRFVCLCEGRCDYKSITNAYRVYVDGVAESHSRSPGVKSRTRL